jgi:hypothetical protein
MWKLKNEETKHDYRSITIGNSSEWFDLKFIDQCWKNGCWQYCRHSSDSSFCFVVEISFWIAATSSSTSTMKHSSRAKQLELSIDIVHDVTKSFDQRMSLHTIDSSCLKAESICNMRRASHNKVNVNRRSSWWHVMSCSMCICCVISTKRVHTSCDLPKLSNVVICLISPSKTIFSCSP